MVQENSAWATDRREGGSYQIKKLASDLLGGADTSVTRTGSGGGTGVMRAPYIDPYMARILSRRGRGGGVLGGFSIPTEPAVDPVVQSINDQIAKYGTQYADILRRLQETVNTERQNIGTASSRAATFMGEIDPMAGYRPTFTALQAPTAAASTYLGAIGANPAQVQAQQALANQLMASQAQDQQAFGSAVDDAQKNYRLAQLAQIYANQAQAESALGTSLGAQQTALSLSQMDREDKLRQALLEYQMQLQLAAMKG